MSKRIIAVSAVALALAFGCEQYGRDQQQGTEPERQGTEQPRMGGGEQRAGGQRGQADQGGETQFNQAPGEDPLAEGGQDQRMQQQRMQEQQQQQQRGHQMGQGAQGAGQIVTMPSENNFNRTVAAINRGLRQNDLEVIANIRITEQMRQRAMRAMQQRRGEQGQQQAQQGQQQLGQGGQGEIGDVRLLIIQRPDVEAQAVESEGPEALLKHPRAVLVFERGEDVMVAYRVPEEVEAPGTEEPTSEILSRVVREATSSSQQQPTAQRQGQQGQQGEGEQQGQEQAQAGGQEGMQEGATQG